MGTGICDVVLFLSSGNLKESTGVILIATLRVALVTRDYRPAASGISTHVQNLEKSLNKLGVETDVIVGGTDFKTLALPITRSLKGYDIVHVQSSPYGAFVRGVPLVVTVHAPVLVEWHHYGSLTRLKSLPAILMEKTSFRNAGVILVVSRTTQSDLIQEYGVAQRKIRLVGNGVDYAKFSSPLGVSRKQDTILLVSRLERRKNVSEALVALSKLNRGSYEELVVGDGTLRVRLQKQAASLGVNARFLGKIDDDNLPGLYQEGGIFLTTSYSEGFGLSLLEAMSAGCAVVASSIPAHADLIQSGSNGLLYNGVPDLTKTLETLLSGPNLARRLGSAATATAKEFSWESVANKVVSAYEECLDRK
jgi:glycosyltransferase involved in cell wall biosynthesis